MKRSSKYITPDQWALPLALSSSARLRLVPPMKFRRRLPVLFTPPRFAMKKGFFGFFAEIFQRHIQRETMPPAQFRKRFFYLFPCIRAGKRRQCPLGKGQAFIRRDKLGIERRHSAYACALRASPLRAVERKKLRRGNRHCRMAFRANAVCRMDDVFPALAGHNDTPLTVFESQFHRISQTGAHVFLDNQPSQ